MMKRRNFLKMSAASLSAANGLAMSLASFNAFSANTSGYRALVCIFLPGGSDGHDLVIPFDATSNQKFSDIRGSIFSQSRHLDNLFSLQGSGANPSSGSLNDGRQFALPPEMSGLGNLYHRHKAAIIGNVGPLIEPTNRTTYLNRQASLPPRLFSHNDQQSVWMASQPEGATAGWAGRFGDIMAAANANGNADFTLVSTSGTEVFTTGETLNGFALTTDGGLALSGASGSVVRDGYSDILHGLGIEHNNLFRRDLEDKTLNALTNSQMMRDVFQSSVSPTTAFPNSSIGQQLKAVATVIANRTRLGASGGGMRRQIFFLRHGANYDTHSGQPEALPAHHQEINDAMVAFYNETVEMGVSEDVTAFTASEFGRTLTPNNSGTDHGWGNHHIVVGGAVNGGQILGNIPEAEAGHSQDSGRGRLIPEVSVEQFAFSLARWFGLSESEARVALPNSGNFDFRELYSLFNRF